MKQISAVLTFASGALFSLFVFSQLAFNDAHVNKPQWYAPPIPAKLSFAGEPAPIERWDVKEKFDRELLLNYYSQGTIVYLLKLANRNFPVISERLKANGVPDDFKYLCIAESNMQISSSLAARLLLSGKYEHQCNSQLYHSLFQLSMI